MKLALAFIFIDLTVCFSGALHFIASNNDCGVREYDMERYQLFKHFRFDWPVNVSTSVYFSNFFYSLILCLLLTRMLEKDPKNKAPMGRRCFLVHFFKKDVS
jgi:hypothetical protein